MVHGLLYMVMVMVSLSHSTSGRNALVHSAAGPWDGDGKKMHKKNAIDINGYIMGV